GRARRGPRRGHRAAVGRPRLGRLPPAPRRSRRGARCTAGDGEGGLMEVVTSQRISVEVDGTNYERDVEARKLLVHFLRDDLDLTGTHVGCDTGNCGACSVIVDGTLV